MIPVFITTCSRNKIGDLTRQYRDWPNHTPVPDKILKCRNSLFGALSPKELRGAVKGPDFDRESGMDGCYLPAYIRYGRGQFMSSLNLALRETKSSKGELDGLLRAWLEDNRLFFISGLYGIVRSLEPIQNYDVVLDDKATGHWKNYQVALTDFLLDSLEKDSILLDCCGDRRYSDLVDWKRIESQHFTVLHAIDTQREDPQVRAASGTFAASVSPALLDRMRNDGKFQDANADLKFVSSHEFWKPRDSTSGHLPRVGVIDRGRGEITEVKKYAERRGWDKCFEFERLETVEAIASARKRGTRQYVLIIGGKEYESHSDVRSWFGGKDPEDVIPEGLLKVNHKDLTKLNLVLSLRS